MNAKNRIVLGTIALSLIVAAAVALRSPRDDVVVQLVNHRTGKPLANVTITNTELHRLPLISSLPFIPYRYRWRTSSHVIKSPNGAFTIKRIFPGRLLDSQRLTLDLGNGISGLLFIYNTNGFWRYRLKNAQTPPLGIVTSRLMRIEVPSNQPVLISVNTNKYFNETKE